MSPRAFAPFRAREHALDGVASARCVHGVSNPEWDTDSLPRRSPSLDERSQRLIHVDSGFVHARVRGRAPSNAARRRGPRGMMKRRFRRAHVSHVAVPAAVIPEEPRSFRALGIHPPAREVQKMLVGLDGKVPLWRALRDAQSLPGEDELVLAHHLRHVHQRLGKRVRDVREELLVRLHQDGCPPRGDGDEPEHEAERKRLLPVGGRLVHEEGLVHDRRRRHERDSSAAFATPSDVLGDEKIMDTFWPDHPPEKARQSLYAALSHMRKALEAGGEGENERVVLARKGFYKFNDDRPWFFDVSEFERQYDTGQSRMRDGREDEAVNAFQKAEALYQGPFMEGYYSDWAVYLKENLELKYTEILETMMDHFMLKERFEVANDYANRLLDIDNCHQEAHINLMTSYIKQGKPAQAIRQYQTCSQVFKDELNLSPPSEMAEMYLEITA